MICAAVSARAISVVSDQMSAMKLALKCSQDGYVQIHKRIYKNIGAILSIAEGSYMDAPHNLPAHPAYYVQSHHLDNERLTFL